MKLELVRFDRPDAELVREVLDGQPEVFNLLVRRWERRVYSYLVHLTGRPEDAFDMCQEVFLAGYRKLSGLRDPERFSQWLFRIAHNTAYSHGREARQQDAGLKDLGAVSESAKAGEAQQWQNTERKILVEKVLEELPFEQREAIVLKFYQGFKLAEIAEIQGCPLSTVKTRVYSGFESLRKLIET